MTHQARAADLLDLARRLRILDSAILAGRQALDEAALPIANLRHDVSVPSTLTGALAAAALNLDRLEGERQAVQDRLDALARKEIPDPTVPDRV